MFHGLVVLLGFAFILTGAFHGNVWFDESYSVAIANHSFQDIWRIGSGDVHPVLFYWCLHVLNLVFGQNVLVYRLFAAAGTLALALLGLFVVRRDFGRRVGLAFSALSLFLPYMAFMAVEIRMYSWASFSVALCAFMAWRIACAMRAQGAVEQNGWWVRIGCDPRLGRMRKWAGAPCRWWMGFFVASLMSAYLHYYGVLSAFIINLFLLVFCVKQVLARRGSRAGRDGLKAASASVGQAVPEFAPAPSPAKGLAVFLVGAVVQVVLYAPWLLVLVGQVGVVSSGTYWSDATFPRTFIEWVLYPVYTSQIIFADQSGWPYVLALYLCGIAAAAAAAVGAADLIRALRKGHTGEGESEPSCGAPRALVGRLLAHEGAVPALLGLLLYLCVLGFGVIASVAMDILIVQTRYLSVALGPLILAASVLMASIPRRGVAYGLVVALLGASVVGQLMFIKDAYSEENQEPLVWFAETVAENQGTGIDGQIPVLSTDIGFEGVTAVTYPDIKQSYLNWQVGNWDLAYSAYAPTLSVVDSWNSILPGYSGSFVVLSQARSSAETKEVEYLLAQDGISMVDSRTFYRPYERTWFTVSVMEKS